MTTRDGNNTDERWGRPVVIFLQHDMYIQNVYKLRASKIKSSRFFFYFFLLVFLLSIQYTFCASSAACLIDDGRWVRGRYSVITKDHNLLSISGYIDVRNWCLPPVYICCLEDGRLWSLCCRPIRSGASLVACDCFLCPLSFLKH